MITGEEIEAIKRAAQNPLAYPAPEPEVILALIARFDEFVEYAAGLERTLKRQAAAAAMGMDEAKRGASIKLRRAEELLGQSNPYALASERAANAMLTDENDRLQQRLDVAEAELRRIHVEQAEAVGFHLGASSPAPDCWKCHDAQAKARNSVFGTRMILCPTCGNKRCPKASDHDLACTGSNEPGQPGSRGGGAPPKPAEGSCKPDCDWGPRQDGDPIGEQCRKCGLVIPF